MRAKSRWLAISLIVLLVWIFILVGGSLFQSSVQQESLEDGIQRLAIPYIAAPLFLIAVVLSLGWGRSVGLKPAEPRRSWRLIWLPSLFIIVLVGTSLFIGPPPLSVVLIMLFNTLLVGFSEELMFRGVVYKGVRSRFSIWPAIWITSIVFGGVHALNGFTTGDFAAATTQAFSAATSGIWFMALRLRTNSLYPGMLVHGLYDFSLFMLLTASSLVPSHTPVATPAPDAGGLSQFLPMLVVDLPLFLYGLWLLRGIGKRESEAILSPVQQAA